MLFLPKNKQKYKVQKCPFLITKGNKNKIMLTFYRARVIIIYNIVYTYKQG